MMRYVIATFKHRKAAENYIQNSPFGDEYKIMLGVQGSTWWVYKPTKSLAPVSVSRGMDADVANELYGERYLVDWEYAS